MLSELIAYWLGKDAGRAENRCRPRSKPLTDDDFVITRLAYFIIAACVLLVVFLEVV